MTHFERLSLIASFATILVNLVAFIAVGWQLRLLAHQNRLAQHATLQDHERRRKQATLEFFAATHERHLEFRKIMPNAWASEEIAAQIKKAIDGDLEMERVIAGYLNLYEHFAAGVRAAVFDLEVVNQMAGGRIVAMVRNYRPWMEHRRNLHNVSDLYAELEWLGQGLLDLRSELGLIQSDHEKQL